MSKDKITVNMNIYDIPILVEELEKANKEINRLNNIIDELEKTLKEEVKGLYNEENPMLLDETYIKYIEDYKEEAKLNKQKKVLDNIKNNNKRIIDYGFDYDGFNNVEDLKKLIDMLVDYARKNYELLEEIE